MVREDDLAIHLSQRVAIENMEIPNHNQRDKESVGRHDRENLGAHMLAVLGFPEKVVKLVDLMLQPRGIFVLSMKDIGRRWRMRARKVSNFRAGR